MFALAATGVVALAALSPIPDISAPLSVPAIEERSLARFVIPAVLAGTLIVTLGAVGIWAFLEQLAMDRGGVQWVDWFLGDGFLNRLIDRFWRRRPAGRSMG